MPPAIAVDFETFYIEKKYGITENGSYGYTHDERFDPYMISVCDGSESWAGHPSAFNWNSLEGATLVSHNAAFDRTVYHAMVERGLAPKIEYSDWQCSANLTSYLCNRRSLAEAAEHLLNVHVDKSMRRYMNGKTWAEAKADGDNASKLLEYARLDAVRCWQIWDKFSPLWPEFERQLSRLTIDQCTRGVQVDRAELDKSIALAQESMHAIESALPWIVEGAKPTSTKAISAQCRKHGIPCPPVKSHDGGEERFALWEATYGPRFTWVAAMGNWRSMGKFLGSLERMKAWLRPDGTMPFALKYFGAHTGRWGGDGGFNLQNLRKEPLYLDDKRLPTEQKTNIALDIRRLFIPRPGKKMIVCDLSQIEPRVLAWLAGNTKLLDEIRGGMAIYEAYGRQVLGWKGGKMKDEDPALYKRAKAEVLALGYGCGAKKYVASAWKMAQYKVEEENAQKQVDDFRAANPKTTALWRQLDTAFKNSCGKEFEMELPSGRVMRYPKVRRELRQYLDPETEKRVKKLVYTADVGGAHWPMYGGLLTENLVQAVSRDVFGEHLLALNRHPGIDVLFSVHDEAVLECDPSVTAKDVEEIMSVTPDWLKGCPIGAESKEVPHYLKA